MRFHQVPAEGDGSSSSLGPALRVANEGAGLVGLFHLAARIWTSEATNLLKRVTDQPSCHYVIASLALS